MLEVPKEGWLPGGEPLLLDTRIGFSHLRWPHGSLPLLGTLVLRLITSTIQSKSEPPTAKPTQGIGQVLDIHIKKTKTRLKQNFSHNRWPITHTGTGATRCAPSDILPIAHFTTNVKSHPDKTKIKAIHDKLNKDILYKQLAPLMAPENRHNIRPQS